MSDAVWAVLAYVRDGLLLTFGAAVLIAEIWLATNATTSADWLLCGCLLALTSFTLYIVLSELWEEYGPTY